MGWPRAAARAFGRSAGRLSPGGRFGSPATSGGGRDLAGVRRGFACCSPESPELGAPGFGCGCIHMPRCRVRHSEPALRSQVSGIEKCQCAPQKYTPTQPRSRSTLSPHPPPPVLHPFPLGPPQRLSGWRACPKQLRVCRLCLPFICPNSAWSSAGVLDRNQLGYFPEG